MAPTRSSWTRLQNLLERLNPGDKIDATAASKETGLDMAACVMVLEGFDLRPFARGHVYDVSTRLGEFLIVSDYAEPEMRQTERAAAADTPRRRRTNHKTHR